MPRLHTAGLILALAFTLAQSTALADDAAVEADAATGTEVTPYQKMVGETFIDDLDGQTVTVRVVYDGLVDSNLVTIYKKSKIKTKDRVFLAHHDPASSDAETTPAPAIPGMPGFALSIAKEDADALLALSPGTVIQVTGTAEKTVFGMMMVKSKGLHVQGTTYSAE